jgi:hypothetical protein
VWKLGVTQKDYEEPRKYLERIAEKGKTSVEAIVQAHKVSPRALRRE